MLLIEIILGPPTGLFCSLVDALCNSPYSPVQIVSLNNLACVMPCTTGRFHIPNRIVCHQGGSVLLDVRGGSP